MSNHETLRERIQEASNYLGEPEGVVLTTFNLDADFLENNALPAALGVEGPTEAARRAELHQKLATTPCTVFYDPTMLPKISGRFRYVARPVPVLGRFFHAKLVILAGQSEEGTTWVYLAVSSANLTLSGWGRNAESFGETWIHTQKQQSWQALDDLLGWLDAHSPLGEKRTRFDAVRRVRGALARMPNRKRLSGDGTEPWSGTLYASLYASVVHKDGLAAFLQGNRTRRPTRLWAYAPYWSDLPDQLAEFDAGETTFVAARSRDCMTLGLSSGQVEDLDGRVTILRNEVDVGDRFCHMKAYWIEHGTTIRTAVGSCNFTRAGLSGAEGNVEAMLVFDIDPDWLPEGEEIGENDLAEESQLEEEAPELAPIAIVVAWDWRDHIWRWWLEPGARQHQFVLQVPDLEPFSIDEGTNAKPGKPPTQGATFTVYYQTEKRQEKWRGQVVELNLDHSFRTYGQPLSANAILESWRGREPTWCLGEDEGSGNLGEHGYGIDVDAPAAFDAVNLYDLYRAMRALREKLADAEQYPDRQRSYLVGRADSVMALANLADRDEEGPTVRYLVLRELCGIIAERRDLLDEGLLQRARDMEKKARRHTYDQLLEELGADQKKAARMLDWFEQEFAKWGRG